MVTLKISEGDHWFQPVRPRRFKDEYVYKLKAAPMVHSAFVNKACGITKSFNPHADSIRIGWRRDKDLVIHWYWYVYENKKRTITEITDLKGVEEITVGFKYNSVVPDHDAMTSETDVQNAVYITKQVENIGVIVMNDDQVIASVPAHFQPSWMTNFYWGGSTTFPNISDSFWIETNVDYSNVVRSYYNAAFSLSPFLASFLPALAMFGIAVGIAQFSVALAVIFVILSLTTLLGYILVNSINYEKWYLSLKSFVKRTRLKLRKALGKKSTTSK